MTDRPPQGTILLVEDDVPIRRLIRRALKADGFRLLEARPDLKVLYMSGYSGATYVNRSIVDRAQDRLLDKPFTRDTLLRTLREVLEDDSSRATGRDREPSETTAAHPS